MPVAGSRILCVDDQPLNLDLFREFLLHEGYEVVTAEDGISAMACLEEGHIDLVVLDAIMPQMSGFRVCELIREKEGLAGLPIIMVSGLSTQENREKGLMAGADCFMSKPFHLRDLVLRIQSMLVSASRREDSAVR